MLVLLPLAIWKGRWFLKEAGLISYRSSEYRGMVLSPDGKMVARFWCEGTYRRSWERKVGTRILTEALHVRLYAIASPDREHSFPLDSVDYRPGSAIYWAHLLQGSIHFSPDSSHLAAVSRGGLLVIDVASKQAQRLHFEGERFGGVRWMSSEEIAFSTSTSDAFRFWRYRADDAPEDRRKVYEQLPAYEPDPGPLRGDDSWSPDNQSVLIRRPPVTGGHALLDLRSGATHALPYVWQHSWKRDGSCLLVLTIDREDEDVESKKVLLVDVPALKVTDLTQEFEKLVGTGLRLTFPWWIQDGNRITFRETVVGDATDPWRYHHVQLRPWKVLHADRRSIERSPAPESRPR